MNNLYLKLELFAFFFITPLILYFKLIDVFEIFFLLVVVLVPLYYILKSPEFDRRALLKKPSSSEVKNVLKRFALLGPLLTVFTVLFFPEYLFSFPLERPELFAAVILLYPLMSVLPQEIAYRAFFLQRYAKLFQNPKTLYIINIIAFAYMHIVFDNIYALFFSAIGGYMFLRTYIKSGSFILVIMEHTFYGWLVFTIGLGRFFYIH